MNNNNLEDINWFYLNKKGFIITTSSLSLSNIFEKKGGIYIYQLMLDNNKIYIGSAFSLLGRLAQHRRCVNNGLNHCPKFYNSVRKYGWDNFRLGVLENVDISKIFISNKTEAKRVLLAREQFYLDKWDPSLNVNKIAGSSLGYKHTEESRNLMSLQRKGRSINWLRKDLSYVVSNETRNNLSLRARHGINVKVFDKNNNIVNTFPTLASAAKYCDIDHSTVSKCIKNGNYIKNYRFEGELKDVRVWVFDKSRNIIGVFSTANKAAEFCNTSHTAMGRYLKSGNLWKGKYYFSRTSCIT